jgi:hypothetical protein
MRGTPLFGSLEGTCADQGLTEVTHGQPRCLTFSRPAEPLPKKTVNLAQGVVSNYPATLSEVFRYFPQL